MGFAEGVSLAQALSVVAPFSNFFFSFFQTPGREEAPLPISIFVFPPDTCIFGGIQTGKKKLSVRSIGRGGRRIYLKYIF